MTLTLHGYWRSGASHRVRIALALKGINYTSLPHNLRAGAQFSADFMNLNPQSLLPVLQAGDLVTTQSLAMLEWLEERFQHPALLPQDPSARAIVRSMAAIVCCDIHPLNNLRVLKRLRDEFDLPNTSISDWISGWMHAGFSALETLVERHGGSFAFADQPTIADCCLAPQFYSARRFGVDLSPFPRLSRLNDRYLNEPAFLAAHPDNQPDADPDAI